MFKETWQILYYDDLFRWPSGEVLFHIHIQSDLTHFVWYDGSLHWPFVVWAISNMPQASASDSIES